MCALTAARSTVDDAGVTIETKAFVKAGLLNESDGRQFDGLGVVAGLGMSKMRHIVSQSVGAFNRHDGADKKESVD